MEKSLTWEDVLAIAKKHIGKKSKRLTKSPLSKKAISKKTKRSQKALAKWKDECHEKDPNLVTLTPNRHNKLFQFALHDKKNRIAYELKLSTANPRVFLDKLSRKLIIYNTLKEANKDFIGLAEEIAGSDYQPIEKVYIFAYNDFIAEYQKPIIQHYFNMIEQKFCFHIEIKSLED